MNSRVFPVFMTALSLCVLALALVSSAVPDTRATPQGRAAAGTVSPEATEFAGVGFSPGGEAEKLVLGVINGAQKELRMAAYTFTSRTVADALLRARRRGVNVAVLLDDPNSGEPPPMLPFLREHKIPFRLNNRYSLMHHKFIVADGRVVQTGSFNYTRAAARSNAENVVVLRDSAHAATFLREWKRLWDESPAPPRA